MNDNEKLGLGIMIFLVLFGMSRNGVSNLVILLFFLAFFALFYFGGKNEKID